MAKNMMLSKTKKPIRYYLHIGHRYLGFFMVGVCLIYGISGIILNHMDGKDPAYKTQEYTVLLQTGLRADELLIHWNDQKELPQLNKVLPIDDKHLRLMFNGGTGVYNTANGSAEYETYTKRQFVYWINRLHYNKVKGWSIMGDLFGASLVFFALSGIFMIKGKKGIAGVGKWFLIAGILIPILYILI